MLEVSAVRETTIGVVVEVFSTKIVPAVPEIA